ncbi:MAG: hypothetical protein JWP87_3688 [Labilithrix sp.]|nr:hypothetical protein [Labilithrix sp.]
MQADGIATSYGLAMAQAKDFGVLAIAFVAGMAVGCAAPSAPGMAVVSSSGASSGPGSMLVAFPASACTGTDSAVFLDDKGGFVAAVAPGTATYLAFPESATHLYVVSSRDVTAQPGTWFRRHEVARPEGRVDTGIVVEVGRIDARQCYRNATPTPALVTFEAATRATKDLKWLDVRADDGTRWLAEHHARVAQLLETPPSSPPPPPAVTTLTRVP